MPLKLKPRLMQPCEGCTICGKVVDGRRYVVHLGNIGQPEWSLPNEIETIADRSGTPVSVRVARAEDVDELLATPSVFAPVAPELSDAVEAVIRESTKATGLSYPYICIARVNGQIAGKLYLDRNPNNAIRRGIGAAIIDNVMVSPAYEGLGVANELLAFAENFAQSNGVRWLEIGATRDKSAANHIRQGTDSLRSYVRRGYYKQPVIMNRELEIHYQYDTTNPTLLAPRYGKAVVVYRDLTNTMQYSESDQQSVFQQLVAAIPD